MTQLILAGVLASAWSAFMGSFDEVVVLFRCS
jgi:hypothetical protein